MSDQDRHQLKELARRMLAVLGKDFKGRIEINVNGKMEAVSLVVSDGPF